MIFIFESVRGGWRKTAARAFFLSQVMVKYFFCSPSLGSFTLEWDGCRNIGKCFINCRKYNLHIMMEAIKLSHYCQDCIHTPIWCPEQYTKLKFSRMTFTTSYTFTTLRVHRMEQIAFVIFTYNLEKIRNDCDVIRKKCRESLLIAHSVKPRQMMAGEM